MQRNAKMMKFFPAMKTLETQQGSQCNAVLEKYEPTNLWSKYLFLAN